MESSARQKALRSAARVALGCYWGAALACGGRSVHDGLPAVADDPDSPPVTSPTAAPLDPVPGPPTQPLLACVPAVTPAGLSPPPGVTQQACCESYVGALVGDGGVEVGAQPLGDPSAANCCRALALYAVWAVNPAHDYCCASAALSPDEFNNPYCAPWGPSVPPALELVA